MLVGSGNLNSDVYSIFDALVIKLNKLDCESASGKSQVEKNLNRSSDLLDAATLSNKLARILWEEAGKTIGVSDDFKD